MEGERQRQTVEGDREKYIDRERGRERERERENFISCSHSSHTGVHIPTAAALVLTATGSIRGGISI